MNRRALLIGISVTPLLCGAKKKRPKGPDVELLEASAHSENGLVMIDGRVKNVGDRTLRKLTVIYELLDSDNNVLTRRKGDIENDSLPQTEEAEFHGQIPAQARSVSFRLAFEDAGERELRAEKTGPFPIE